MFRFVPQIIKLFNDKINDFFERFFNNGVEKINAPTELPL